MAELARGKNGFVCEDCGLHIPQSNALAFCQNSGRKDMKYCYSCGKILLCVGYADDCDLRIESHCTPLPVSESSQSANEVRKMALSNQPQLQDSTRQDIVSNQQFERELTFPTERTCMLEEKQVTELARECFSEPKLTQIEDFSTSALVSLEHTLDDEKAPTNLQG